MTLKSKSLRNWQKKALDKAIHHYQSGNNNFLCIAAPGAGKTRFAATAAKALLDEGLVDIVICIAPSKAVSAGTQKAFSSALQDPFNGKIGSIGLVVTYQSLQYCYGELAQLVINHSALIVSDEIHHCGFDPDGESNKWGYYVSALVSESNTLALTLSGTPWRSDKSKVALQQYSDDHGLVANFIYGLGEAVRDRVCRSPKMVLLDNSKITVSKNDEHHVFKSISEGVSAKKLSYLSLINSESVRSELLTMSVNELHHIKRTQTRAAGLVVASTVSEARRIQSILINSFDQSAQLVCNELPESQDIISGFQHSDVDWLVSVGMVSEGTDIPRLQVCTYLSHIRTELYFRQVLGRILRINHSYRESAVLFSLADPELLKFAERVSLDLPEEAMEITQKPAGPDLRLGESTYNQSEGGDLRNDYLEALAETSFQPSSRIALSEITESIANLCSNSYRNTILSL